MQGGAGVNHLEVYQQINYTFNAIHIYHIHSSNYADFAHCNTDDITILNWQKSHIIYQTTSKTASATENHDI